MKLNNILFAGAGALGALYSHKMSGKNRNICFLAEGERQKRLEKEGLIINRRHYPVKCTGGDSSIKADLVIIAVKYHHLDEVIENLRKHVTEDTAVISVMNGIDTEEIIKSGLQTENIFLTMVLGMDAVREGNSISFSNEGKVVFAPWSGRSGEYLKPVQDFFTECSIAWETPDNMLYQIWYKFMINTGINQVSAVLGAEYRIMQNDSHALWLMDETMKEVIKIANAENIPLSEKDLENWYKILHSLGPDKKTSMCQDILAGRKTEVEMFAGKIIQLAEKHSIEVPFNRVLFNLIKAKEITFL